MQSVLRKFLNIYEFFKISWEIICISLFFFYLGLFAGLCRCASLKKLILARNKLITLPEAIHLTELLVLDLKAGCHASTVQYSRVLKYMPVGIHQYNFPFA
jgi:hypothetical protein